MQSSNRTEEVCRYSRRPGGCKNRHCQFFHPQQFKKSKKGFKRGVEDDYQDVHALQEATKRKRRRLSSNEKEEVVLIPDRFVGKLLGSHGCKIKEVKDGCRAYINVSGPGDVVEGDQRIICIQGTAADIEEAKKALFYSLIETTGIEFLPLKPNSERNNVHLNAKVIAKKVVKFKTPEARILGNIQNEKSEDESNAEETPVQHRKRNKAGLDVIEGSNEARVKKLEKEFLGIRDRKYTSDTTLFDLKKDYINIKLDLNVKKAELIQSNQVCTETSFQNAELKLNLENSRQIIKELKEKLENCEKQNKIYLDELKDVALERNKEILNKAKEVEQKEMDIKIIKDLKLLNRERKNDLEQNRVHSENLKQKKILSMLNKGIQTEHKEIDINPQRYVHDYEIRLKENYEALQKQMKINENMKYEIDKKKKVFEAQNKALKALEQECEEEKKFKVQNGVELSQMKEEMLINQMNLEKSLNEIKLRDLKIQQHLTSNIRKHEKTDKMKEKYRNKN
eukprot:GFUD01029712.1.p1 GENE.GFUD01029712.1~~GFUD01029712.1.p1  ORF type:complete len:509 (-),score=159.63 GFUD01029712.1:64-1590(-)